jgi:uncharacterized protein YuzE
MVRARHDQSNPSGTSVDTREIGPDIRLDVDEEGRPVGLDIDRASLSLDLNVLEARGLPHVSVSGAAAPTTRPALEGESGQPA